VKARAIRSENVDMSNEKDGEKPFGRKPKGSNMKRISSWVRTVPNEKLKGEIRWEIKKSKDYGEERKESKEFRSVKRNPFHGKRMNRLHPGKNPLKKTVLETDTGG
jgi:hypothetical protein